jgi:hypothetical protein
MEKGVCRSCRKEPLVGRQRKYCRGCGPLASALWKREHRRLWKAAGDRYWLDDWASRAERRAYNRTYMRRYRRRVGIAPAAVITRAMETPGDKVEARRAL